MERSRLATAQAKKKVLEYIEKGHRLEEALAYANRSRSAYELWRRKDQSFAQAVDKLRKGDKRDEQGRQVPDFPEFCERYLGQRLYHHQLQWFDMLEGRPPRDLHPSQIYEPGDPNFLLINTPPEHAKTTTISINYATWRIIKDPNVRIIFVSKTQTMATQFMYAIKSRLTHPRYIDLQMDFAPPGGWRQDAAVWSNERVYLGQERDSGEKDPTMQAVGIAGQIYGARAELILVDDAVVLSNAHEFEKGLRWLQQEALTRLGPTGRLLVVGTRVDAVDLYRELRNTERYPSGKSPWTYLSQPAVLEYAEDPKDWVTLWPRADEPWAGEAVAPDKDGMYPRWDGRHLARRRGMLATRTWSLAYMQAEVEEDAVFPEELVRAAVNGQRQPGPMRPGAPGHRPTGMEGLYVIGSMDPAMVGDTGVVVYAVDRHTRMRYVLHVEARTRATPKWIRDTIQELTERYGIHQWVIERNAFQAFLTQDEELNTWLATRGTRLSEHTTGSNKWAPDFGVASMAPLFTNGLVELPASHVVEGVKQFITQLITWSPETKAKTDLVMAFWFAEIRAREVANAAAVNRGEQNFVNNRFLTKRAQKQRMVMNLNDLAVARTRSMQQGVV